MTFFINDVGGIIKLAVSFTRHERKFEDNGKSSCAGLDRPRSVMIIKAEKYSINSTMAV